MLPSIPGISDSSYSTPPRLADREPQQLHDEGFQIYTYTVNEPKDIKSVTELGVDGIFCNFPERLH